jgi:hypothetical protein
MAPIFKILIFLGPKTEPEYSIHFSQKVPSSESPLGSPVGSLWGEILICRPTGSPQTGALRHHSHWPSEGIRFIHSFIYVCQSPQKAALLHAYRKNIRSPSTVPQADGRPTYNGVQPGSPRGLLRTLLSLLQCHSALGTILSTLAWVDQIHISQPASQPVS